MNLLINLYNLLLPESRYEIRKVLCKLNLPYDYVYDMEQDSFLKLVDIINKFEVSRSCHFIAFWQKVLFNYLISKYSKRRPLQPIPTNIPCKDIIDHDTELADLIETKFQDLIEHWVNESDREIALVIFHTRFLPKHDELSQIEVAQLLHLSQSHVHRWETYILQQLRHLAHTISTG